MEMTRAHEITLDDATLVAGLNLDPDIMITPEKLPNGRITFRITGDGVEEAIARIYSNPPVKIFDYIRSLKAIKTIIFNLKVATEAADDWKRKPPDGRSGGGQ
ncbi:MAG: hypothetical protein Kow0025_18380 [Thermodesulfovibrionales bacterium]